MRRYSGGFARTTVHQNLVLRWVRDESVYEVWQELLALGLGEAGADEISDGVSCPGTDSCKLGITSSMGLNGAIQERIAEMAIDDPLTRRIHIKNSGCPNGCGQHHIADIGFYGASIKVGEKTVPAYIPHIGGKYEGGEVRYGQRLKARLPAKRVPEAVERWVRFYESDRQDWRAVPRIRGPGRRRRVRGPREGSDDADRIQPREHELLHRLQPRGAVPGHPRRGGVRGLSTTLPDLEGATAQEVLAYGVEQFHPRLTLACSFQKEESVLFHMLSELEGGRGGSEAGGGNRFTRSRSTPASSSPRRWRRGSSSRTGSRRSRSG